MQIGELAKLTRISMRMLRHYDEIGLFKPALVRENTYREYSVAQLPLLNRILALKDLGFSLEQIRDLVQQGFPNERLRDVLALRQTELENHIQHESERLAKVKERLTMLEHTQTAPALNVHCRAMPAQLVASVRDASLDEFRVDGNEKTRSMRRHVQTLAAHVERHGIAAGFPFTIIGHPPLAEDSILVDLEVVCALPKHIPASDQVRVYTLEATPIMACLEHTGPDDWRVLEGQLMPSLYAWAESNGFRAVGPMRQAFLEYARPDDLVRFELQLPIAQQ